MCVIFTLNLTRIQQQPGSWWYLIFPVRTSWAVYKLQEFSSQPPHKTISSSISLVLASLNDENSENSSLRPGKWASLFTNSNQHIYPDFIDPASAHLTFVGGTEHDRVALTRAMLNPALREWKGCSWESDAKWTRARMFQSIIVVLTMRCITEDRGFMYRR